MPASGSPGRGATGPGAMDPDVIREAARWLVRLHSGEAGPEDHAALERWRRTDPRHELAWQRAECLSREFGAIPPRLGVPVLTRRSGLNRRALIKTLAVLGTALPVGWLVYRDAAWFMGEGAYRTAVGESRDLLLADGSRIQLNTSTDLQVRYSDAARLLQLRRGEIYIQTAADAQAAARPFLVDTAMGRLRALGTRFVVKQVTGDETCLSVLEHRVEVTLRSDGSRRIVDPGKEIRFTAAGFRTPPVARPSTDARAAADPPGWTRGVLQADDMRLDAFLDELSRYRRGVIRCDPDVAALKVSGVFRLADTDHILAVVGQTLPVRVLWHTRYWVTVTTKAT
ncbi:FecR domain-containing protein [Bordetella flabilis]|nr:FecR domain-containing protein [Bordetella flabilis]